MEAVKVNPVAGDGTRIPSLVRAVDLVKVKAAGVGKARGENEHDRNDGKAYRQRREVPERLRKRIQ